MRAAVIALAAVAALATGCGASEEQVGASSSAQRDLPAPVRAHTSDPSAPQTLTVGDTSAPIDAVATDPTGALLPPQDISRLGWWVDSALPGGNTGTIVITGHVDDASQGQGFATRFSTLAAGDAVTVHTADGTDHRYRIKDVETLDKEKQFPADELNRLDGQETLALITCGGPFIGPPLGYRDNVVAYATPLT